MLPSPLIYRMYHFSILVEDKRHADATHYVALKSCIWTQLLSFSITNPSIFLFLNYTLITLRLKHAFSLVDCSLFLGIMLCMTRSIVDESFQDGNFIATENAKNDQTKKKGSHLPSLTHYTLHCICFILYSINIIAISTSLEAKCVLIRLFG